jgi:hypothetical protein
MPKRKTRTIINIDGIKVRVQAPDLDENGEIGGVETVEQSLKVDIIPVKESSELGDSLKELNKDDIETGTRMSGIDLRSRLHYIEISSVLALDSLVSLGILPTKCLSFSRQKKRLSVSLQGKGRDDIVNLVAGKRELETKQGTSLIEGIKSKFGGGTKAV